MSSASCAAGSGGPTRGAFIFGGISVAQVSISELRGYAVSNHRTLSESSVYFLTPS